MIKKWLAIETSWFCKKNRQPLLFLGMSGHGKVAVDIMRQSDQYDFIGFIDHDPARSSDLNYPYLGDSEEIISELIKQHPNLKGFIAIGDNWRRYLVMQKMASINPGFSFVTLIHPSAQIGSHVTIGIGSIVMAQAVIQSGSTVGNFCIINTKASLDHDSFLHDFASLAPNATTGGGVVIGPFTAVGLGANVIHGCHIGEQSVIGAGACVLQDIPDQVVAYGVPARVIRSRQAGDHYL